MPRSTAFKAIVLLTLALAALFQIQEHRLREARAKTMVAGLEATNALAANDSTRDRSHASAKLASILGDSLRLVERRVMQIGQRRDALDRALGLERRARYALTATVDSLTHVASVSPSPLKSDDGTRAATFNIHSPPYTVLANVFFPPLPDSAELALRISVDPIPISARVMCGEPNEFGVRTASITTSSPPWAKVSLGVVEQAAEVCHAAEALTARPHRRRLEFTPVVIGAGRIIRPNGSGSWGWFIGAGFTFRT
jgi:hypothetical protein